MAGILNLFKKQPQQDMIFKGCYYKTPGPDGEDVLDVKVIEVEASDSRYIWVELPGGELVELNKSFLIDDHFGKIGGRKE